MPPEGRIVLRSVLEKTSLVLPMVPVVPFDPYQIGKLFRPSPSCDKYGWFDVKI